jgi:hypothetical protein
MRATFNHGIVAIILIAGVVSAVGQTPSTGSSEPRPQVPLAPADSDVAVPAASPNAALVAPAVQQLLDFKDSDVKFDLQELMDILRDRRHEGWVLAAYPDPKTSRPLIGAGFTLDLPEREHPQTDPLNAHTFIEPSSAELWQAAGLDAGRLQSILDQYNANLAAWKARKFRKRIGTLTPEITDEEATQLLRVAAIQAIVNAKAYCRNFDSYSASQQMALSQLVYQMGFNLQEFGVFLNLINSDASALAQVGDGTNAATATSTSVAAGVSSGTGSETDSEVAYWKAVQKSLMESQWARLYRVRAVAVIAMLDPQWSDAPPVAERRVGAVLRPAIFHRRRDRGTPSLRVASHGGRSAKASRKRKAHTRSN